MSFSGENVIILYKNVRKCDFLLKNMSENVIFYLYLQPKM